MTDITELAQRMKAAAVRAKAATEDYVAHRMSITVCLEECKEFNDLSDGPDNILALVEALEKAPQAPIMPLGLHPDTQKLVTNFCTALAEKLYKAQLKYGYDTDWKQDGWPSQCQAHFHQHIAKGDPRDVAAYCAFMWWHGWSTKPAEGTESHTVTVKLPDYRNTYKAPLADEVEHQVRLALELFSSAAGIKVEAESWA